MAPPKVATDTQHQLALLDPARCVVDGLLVVEGAAGSRARTGRRGRATPCGSGVWREMSPFLITAFDRALLGRAVAALGSAADRSLRPPAAALSRPRHCR